MTRKRATSNEQRTTKVAVLDRDGVYQGMAEVEELGPLHVEAAEFGGACDLPPGQYRWDRKERHFMPLPRTQHASADIPPDALRAIWKALAHLRDRGEAFPTETERWIAAYGKTLDAKS